METVPTGDAMIQILSVLLTFVQQYPIGAKFVPGVAMLTSIVGVASLLVEPITALTKITPTTKDDEIAGVFGKCVRFAVKFLSFIARNPK